MRATLAKSLAAAIAVAGISSVANAQVLASADNSATTTYTSGFNQFFALDGSSTALTFRTTKANEIVQFDFAGGRCGITQTASASASVLNESLIQGFFYLDGALHDNGSGFADTLCSYNVYPQGPYMQQWSSGHMQQRVVVPDAGTHTLNVLFQVIVSADGTNIYPVFGQSHVSVSK